SFSRPALRSILSCFDASLRALKMEWGPGFAPGRGLAPVRSWPRSSGQSTAKPHPRRVCGPILSCTLVRLVTGYSPAFAKALAEYRAGGLQRALTLLDG